MRTGLLLTVVACGACGPGVEVTPAEGSSFGHFSVTVRSDALSTLDATVPWTATVGGVAAYDVARVDSHTVRFTVQGHPQPGLQPVVVIARRVAVETGGTLRYLAPSDKRFSKLVAFGASLTMGSQDASVSQRSQLHGPATIIARQAGAFLGLPLLKDGYLPALLASDIDPATCRPKQADIFKTIGSRAETELVPKLKDTGGNISIGKMRVDPTMTATNVAIGGFRVAETVDGAKSLFGTILEHVVWDTKVDAAGLISAPQQTELDRVTAAAPTIAITTDLFGNDYNNVNLYTDGLPDLTALTPVEEVRASLRQVMDRLDATGAEAFLATGPDNTVLPAYGEKVARLRAAGFSDADANGWLTAMRTRIGEYNDVLREEAKSHPRVHVVDLHAKIATVLSEGVQIGGETLKPYPFGGLLSMDAMHFSDTGYAVLANTFLEQINASLGTKIPLADLAAIHSTDPYSVEALRAAGLGCAGTTN